MPAPPSSRIGPAIGHLVQQAGDRQPQLCDPALAGQSGAVVTGTEDPVLLQEEYEFLKASMADDVTRRSYAARAAGLLSERDRYIAARVDAAVPAGGTGVLFAGLQHKTIQAVPPIS
jgi:hypothetical protein